MFVFTDNKCLKKELKIFQINNDIGSVSDVCRKMKIIPQAYYNILKKQNLSFNDIKRICDAMDAELCIEIRKREK